MPNTRPPYPLEVQSEAGAGAAFTLELDLVDPPS